MHPYEFNISFRLTHPTKGLAGLYEKLSTLPGFIPRRIWKVGDDRKTQAGEKLEGQYDKSYCYFDFSTAPQKSTVESPSSVIEKILNALVSFNNDLQDHVESGGESEFFIGMYIDSNSAESFMPDLLLRLGEMRIRLSVDIYPKEK